MKTEMLAGFMKLTKLTRLEALDALHIIQGYVGEEKFNNVSLRGEYGGRTLARIYLRTRAKQSQEEQMYERRFDKWFPTLKSRGDDLGMLARVLGIGRATKYHAKLVYDKVRLDDWRVEIASTGDDKALEEFNGMFARRLAEINAEIALFESARMEYDRICATKSKSS